MNIISKINFDNLIKNKEQSNFKLYYNIWHYSFNDVFLKSKIFYLAKTKSKRIIYGRPLNQFSPTPIFTENNLTIQVNLTNSINEQFQKNNRTKRNIFWYLKIDNFDNFLKRRTENATNPKKHFPTIYTYNKIKEKINSNVEISALDKDLFIEHYDKLKSDTFFTGKEVLELLDKNNPSLPIQWVKMAVLNYNNKAGAIALIVDDNKSISLINIVAERTELSLGVYLCTELVKYCCDKNYYSFDAGISGMYGVYKDKIFLDSFEVYLKNKTNYLRFIEIYKIDFWKKVFHKITKTYDRKFL